RSRRSKQRFACGSWKPGALILVLYGQACSNPPPSSSITCSARLHSRTSCNVPGGRNGSTPCRPLSETLISGNRSFIDHRIIKPDPYWSLPHEQMRNQYDNSFDHEGGWIKNGKQFIAPDGKLNTQRYWASV